jgi:phosphate transport system permease protein
MRRAAGLAPAVFGRRGQAPPLAPRTPEDAVTTGQISPASSWQAPARTEREALKDRLFLGLCRLAALSVLALAALLFAFLVRDSWPALRAFGFRFFTHARWDPVQGDYGALAFIYGTLVTSAVAMLIAVPLGVGTAAFLAEIAPGWLRRGGSFLIELLAAIPSVVYGFWGLFFLAPAVQLLFDRLGGPNHGGAGLFSAGLILSVMIVPYVAAISYDVCRAVPRSQREGALALGATRWQTIWGVVLPYARPGIIGASFLALGRALGETMAVTMLVGNQPTIHFSLFALGDSIASVIANQLNEAGSDLQRAALVELGLVLLFVTVFVNCLARLLIWRVGREPSAVRRWLFPAKRVVVPPPKPGEAPRLRPADGRAWLADRLMTVVLGACLFLTLGVLFLILGYITYRGLSAVNLDFFTNLPVPKGEPHGGLAHALYGSALLVGLASLFAVPLGILGAIYLAEYRTHRLVPTVRFVAELLGGVPSIVIGIFAYALLVAPLGHFSGWAGAFALGVMMIPIVLRASEESLKLVPESLRNASYALGAARWQTVLRVTVPAALPAIITGVFLAVARIAGETAPLLLTAYNSNYWPRSPGDRTPFLPYYIYYYSRSGDPDWERQAWAAALVLLAVVMALNVGIRLLTGRRVLLASRAD